MNYFLVLLLKILPLYLLVVLGYIASKNPSINKKGISALLLYFFSPVVGFHGVVTMDLKPELLTLPFLSFGMCLVSAVIFYLIGSNIWSDAHKNILTFASSQGNSGYFGIPVAIALFGQDILGIYIFLWLGMYIFAFTGGYIIVAHGHHTLKESILKFFKVPVIYAVGLALFLNISNIIPAEGILEITGKFTAAYTILGMMILGINLSQVQKTSLDWAFTIWSFIARFIFWPIMAGLIIWLDTTYFHLYNQTIYELIFLISIVPIAADTVAFATEFKIHPEKVALTVFMSTIFALLFIPAILSVVF